MNFYIDQNNVNRVRTKGNTGITAKQFKENPIFDRIRFQGSKMGKASKIAQNFRMIANIFNQRAKDGSFAGRSNKLMLEILNEDTSSTSGENSFEEGMKSEEAITYFVGFEGNKLRPLKKALTAKWNWDETTAELTIKKFNPLKHLDWLEEAEAVHMAIAYANWDYKNSSFGRFQRKKFTRWNLL